MEKIQILMGEGQPPLIWWEVSPLTNKGGRPRLSLSFTL